MAKSTISTLAGQIPDIPYREQTTHAIRLGDQATAALLMGGGIATAGSRLTDAATTAKNFMAFYTESIGAGAVDKRGLYWRHYFSAAGLGGEVIRAYATVTAACATGGTINGIHASCLIDTGGSISGAANALRATLEIGASVNPGGTLACIQADSNFGASATVPATAAFFRLDNVGAAPSTNGIPLLFNILNPETSNFFVNAGTGANSAGVSTGGVAAKVLKCSVGGTAYWLPLFSSNA